MEGWPYSAYIRRDSISARWETSSAVFVRSRATTARALRCSVALARCDSEKRDMTRYRGGESRGRFGRLRVVIESRAIRAFKYFRIILAHHVGTSLSRLAIEGQSNATALVSAAGQRNATAPGSARGPRNE